MPRFFQSPQGRLIASATGKYEILAMAVGPWHPSKKGPTGKPIYSTEESLRASVSVFEGVPVAAYELKPGFHDHLPDGVLAAVEENGIVFLKNRVGRLKGARFGETPKGDRGILVGFEVTDPVVDEAIKASLTDGYADFDGFSIDGSAEWDVITVDGVQYDHPKRLTSLRTLDVVKYPAAGGKVLRLAASQALEETEMNLTPKQLAILGALLRAAGVTGDAQSKIWADKADVLKESVAALRLALKDRAEPLKLFEAAVLKIEKNEELDAQFTSFEKLTEELAKQPTASAVDDAAAKAKADQEAKTKADAEAAAKVAADAAKAKQAAQDPAVAEANKILEEAKKLSENAVTVMGEAAIEKEVTASHLPDLTKVQLTQRLKASRVYEGVKIKAEIDKEAQYLQKLLGDQYVPMLRVTGSIEIPRTEVDNLIFGMRAMLIGEDPVRRARLQKEAGNTPVNPFRSWREVNARVTGSRYDEPLDKVFRKLGRLATGIGYEASDMVDLNTGRLTGSFTSSDLASVYLVAVHKQFLSDYQTPSQYDAWRKIAKIVSLKDLYTHYFARSGWYAAAGSIAEGGTYQETTTSASDEHIGLTGVKYGQILSITDVMVINDNIGAMQRLQMALSDGMKRDIYTAVFSPILSNSAVAYGSDTDTLVHANHSNGAASGGSSLLTADSAILEAGWNAMFAQNEYGSGMKLGELNKPRYLICHSLGLPNALRLTRGERAIQMAGATAGGFTSGADYLPDAAMLNAMAQFGIEPVVALGATVTTNWWLTADPNVTPAPPIVVGFLNGQEQPEVVTEPAGTGSNFTADKIRFKVKNWRDVEPGDHRGIYGQIA